MHSLLSYSESDILSVTYILGGYNNATFGNLEVFTYSFEAEKQRDFCLICFYYKKNIDGRYGSDARGDRKLLYFFVWPSSSSSSSSGSSSSSILQFSNLYDSKPQLNRPTCP